MHNYIIGTFKHTAGIAIIVYRFFTFHHFSSQGRFEIPRSVFICRLFDFWVITVQRFYLYKKKTLSAAILFPVTTFCFVIEKICRHPLWTIQCMPLLCHSFRFSLWSLWYLFQKQNILRIYWRKTNNLSTRSLIYIYMITLLNDNYFPNASNKLA